MIRKCSSRSALASATPLIIAFAAAWIFHWSSEEYAVYDAAIREAFSDEPIPSYVILDTTVPWSISKFNSEKLGMPLSARMSYNTRNLFHFHIAPRFLLPHPFNLVRQSELDGTAPSHAESVDTDELVNLVRRSGGAITLSRVGFDLEGKHAIVYAQLTYCGVCGGGMFLYLSRTAGTWHIIGRAETWVS